MTKEDKPKYWGVYEGEDTVFRGTHTDCWNYLVDKYATFEVKTLVQRGVRIARTN